MRSGSLARGRGALAAGGCVSQEAGRDVLQLNDRPQKRARAASPARKMLLFSKASKN
jgi:hypothetical protein